MLAQQVAKKYSMALFELARDKNIIDQAWEQFGSLQQFLKADRTFLDFMTAPQINDEKKRALIEKAFAGKLEAALFDFLMFLADKRRIKFLPEIIEEFDRRVREHKGIAKAVVVSAVPLSDEERQRIITELARKTSLKIELEEKIDKSVIGGMIIKLHDQIIDGSIRRGLDLLRNRLMKVKVH
jgi:F-type H+-transporting ATPase subunit delta